MTVWFNNCPRSMSKPFFSNVKILVKNVTLVRKNKIAEFPDAVTSRGTKHLNQLCKAKEQGYQSYILYLIQRENCDSFNIAEDIDEKYKNAFCKALNAGVKILCYDCKLNNDCLLYTSDAADE